MVVNLRFQGSKTYTQGSSGTNDEGNVSLQENMGISIHEPLLHKPHGHKKANNMEVKNMVFYVCVSNICRSPNFQLARNLSYFRKDKQIQKIVLGETKHPCLPLQYNRRIGRTWEVHMYCLSTGIVSTHSALPSSL